MKPAKLVYLQDVPPNAFVTHHLLKSLISIPQYLCTVPNNSIQVSVDPDGVGIGNAASSCTSRIQKKLLKAIRERTTIDLLTFQEP